MCIPANWLAGAGRQATGCCIVNVLRIDALYVLLVCVVLVGAERALADCVLERDVCMLTADCVGGDLLHPLEECKEVSQGKSTNISRSML